MPTTAIAVQTLSSGFSQTGDSISFTAADSVNGNHAVWPSTSKLLYLVARNVHATTAYTVSATSVAYGSTGRTGDISAVSLAAGTQKIFPLAASGWKNTSDQVAFSANNNNIQFAILAAS